MNSPYAKATILIRRPVATVFDAFVRPETITAFWLEATSAPLAPGVKATWRFMVPGATETVTVTKFDPPGLLEFDWSDGKHVTLTFHIFAPGITQVTAVVSGFDLKAGVPEIADATEGFAIVLCDLKTLLESGRSANLVRDKAELIAATHGNHLERDGC